MNLRASVLPAALRAGVRACLGAVAALGAGLAGCSEGTSATHVVLRPAGEQPGSDDPPRTIKALGRIEPDGGVVSITGTPGARIARVRVQEGSTVKAGDELLRLDSYETLDANCRSLQAQLDEAKELLAIERDHSAQRVRELEIEDEQVRVLNRLDITAQEHKLKALELKLAHEEREAQRLKGLQDARSSLVAEQQVEAQSLLVDGARAEQRAAAALLAKLTKGQSLAERKLGLQKSQLALASRKDRLAAHEQALAASLDAAQRQRDQAIIRAPRDGQILRVLMHDGETIGNQPVLQLGDTRAMCIVADVSDLYIRDLRRARHASATALGDSLEGTIRPSDIGRIVGKSTIPSLDPTVDSDRRVVEVVVRLDPESSAKARDFTNLRVDVIIALDGSEAAREAGTSAPARAGPTAR